MRARQQKDWEEAKKKAIKVDRDVEEAVAGIQSGEDLFEEIMHGLQRGLEKRVASQFARLQMDSVDAGESMVSATLKASNRLLVELDVVEREVAPCFPPIYDIMSVFRDTYRSFLRSLLLPLVCGEDRMADYDLRDILDAIKFLDYYHNEVEKCDEFAEAVVGLNSAYLGRIKGQIMQWVHNLKGQKLELVNDDEGRFVTTLPHDMFNLINIQASKTLPDNFLGAVVLTCLEVLQDIQEDNVTWMEGEWRRIYNEDDGLEQLCAMVNDNVRLQ
ncbi:unnamed protein product, partial [Discosporangium mesarthrocarpum]